MFCETGKCKDNEYIWGVVSRDTQKLHRLTFSKGLADFIVETHPEFEVKRFQFMIGEKLENGEKSPTGLYALVSTKGDFALRISLIQGVSELHTDESRYLATAYLV